MVLRTTHLVPCLALRAHARALFQKELDQRDRAPEFPPVYVDSWSAERRSHPTQVVVPVPPFFCPEIGRRCVESIEELLSISRDVCPRMGIVCVAREGELNKFLWWIMIHIINLDYYYATPNSSA